MDVAARHGLAVGGAAFWCCAVEMEILEERTRPRLRWKVGREPDRAYA